MYIKFHILFMQMTSDTFILNLILYSVYLCLCACENMNLRLNMQKRLESILRQIIKQEDALTLY